MRSAKALISLCWSHKSYCRFCRAVPQLWYIPWWEACSDTNGLLSVDGIISVLGGGGKGRSARSIEKTIIPTDLPVSFCLTCYNNLHLIY